MLDLQNVRSGDLRKETPGLERGVTFWCGAIIRLSASQRIQQLLIVESRKEP